MKLMSSLSVLALTSLLGACSNQEPAFSSSSSSRKIDVLVEADDGTAGSAPAPGEEHQVSSEEIDSIFEDLNGDSADGTAADGGADGSAADGGADGSATDGGTDGSATDGGTDGSAADGGDTTVDGLDTTLNSSERRACARFQGVEESVVQVASGDAAQTFKTGSVLAFKLSGGGTQVDLNLRGAEGAWIRGLCFFLIGDESVARVAIGLTVGGLLFDGRGNGSIGDFAFDPGARLATLAADLSGNGAQLTLRGDADYPCETVRLSGSEPVFTCK